MITSPTPTNSQVTVWELRHLLFSSLSKPCFAYCLAHWRSPGVCILPSSFWSITLKCLDADQSTIPNMKGDILSFHMRHRSMICSKRLQRNSIRIPIEESYLVILTQTLTSMGVSRSAPGKSTLKILKWWNKLLVDVQKKINQRWSQIKCNLVLIQHHDLRPKFQRNYIQDITHWVIEH